MIELANKVLSARLEIVECSGCGTERFRIDAVTERLAKEYLAAQQRVDNLTADNARLREAIQSVLGYVALPHRYREELEAAIEQS